MRGRESATERGGKESKKRVAKTEDVQGSQMRTESYRQKRQKWGEKREIEKGS